MKPSNDYDNKHKLIYDIDEFTQTLRQQVKSHGISNICREISNITEKKLSSKVVSNKLNPEQDNHLLSLNEFILIMKILEQSSGHLSILAEFLKIFGLKFEEFKDNESYEISYKSILNAWIGWDKERSEVQDELKLALEDNKIGRSELSRIKKEMNDDIIAMTKLQAMLEQAYNEGRYIK